MNSQNWKEKMSYLKGQDCLVKIFKNKTKLFYSEKDDKFTLVFSDAKYDINTLEGTLHLYKNIKSSFLFTRSVSSDSKNISKIVDLLHDNVRKFDTAMFNPTFARSIEQYCEDILSLYLFLEVKN